MSDNLHLKTKNVFLLKFLTKILVNKDKKSLSLHRKIIADVA